MQETLISFETAKLAKEKGFELDKYLSINDENPKNLNSNYNPRDYQPWYFDLTQSLLQKWLREVHDIHIKIFPEDDTCNNRIWDISLFQLNYGQDKEVHYLNSNGCKKTFEEALEIGLLEALKLIKK